MSVLRALQKRHAPEERSVPWASFGPWSTWLATGPTTASHSRSLQSAPVWAAIGLITDAIARTPIDVVRYVGGARQNVEPLPRLIADPNPTFVTPTAWRRQLGFSLATHGNAIGVVQSTDSFGLPREVTLVDPWMATLQVKEGRKWIGVNGDFDTTWENGGRYWHCTGRDMAPGNVYGLSWLEAACKTIGLGLAAEDFSNAFFSDGGHPTWGLASDRDLTADEASGIKQAFLAAIRPGSREPFVHGAGLKPEQFSVQPGETQFIDTMRFVCEQVARFAHVPASAIGAAMSGQSVTYSNVTDADLRTLKDTFIGYFVEIESALTNCLPRPQVVKFNQDAILRGDPKLRTEIIAAQIQAGLLSVNEGRKLLDLEPWAEPEYDQPFAHTPDPVAQDPSSQGPSNDAPDQ